MIMMKNTGAFTMSKVFKQGFGTGQSLKDTKIVRKMKQNIIDISEMSSS